MSVDWLSHKGDNQSPASFLLAQVSKWSPFWSPTDQEYINRVVGELQDYWAFAKEECTSGELPSFAEFCSKFNAVIDRYKKDTLGSDNWKCSELRVLPPSVRAVFAIPSALSKHS